MGEMCVDATSSGLFLPYPKLPNTTTMMAFVVLWCGCCQIQFVCQKSAGNFGDDGNEQRGGETEESATHKLPLPPKSAPNQSNSVKWHGFLIRKKMWEMLVATHTFFLLKTICCQMTIFVVVKMPKPFRSLSLPLSLGNDEIWHINIILPFAPQLPSCHGDDARPRWSSLQQPSPILRLCTWSAAAVCAVHAQLRTLIRKGWIRRRWQRKKNNEELEGRHIQIILP